MVEEIESLTSQGAITLSNKELINDLKELFESFIKLIADSIDRKSFMQGVIESIRSIQTLDGFVYGLDNIL